MVSPASGLERRATTQLLVGQVAYRGLTAVFWVVLARAALPGEVGEFAIANSVAVPVFVGLDAGLNQFLVREFDPASGFPAYVRRLVRWRSTLVLVGCLGSSVGTALLVSSETAWLTGLLVGAGYALDFLCQAWLSPDRAALEMRPDRLMKLVQGGGALLLLLVAHAVWTVDAVSAATVVLVAYGLAAVHPIRRWRTQRRWSSDDAATGSLRAKWRSAGAFAATGILTAFYTRIDDVFVQIDQGVLVVASYTLAYKVVETARLPSWAITRVVLARESASTLVDRTDSGRPIRLSTLISAVAALSCAAVGPVAMETVYGSGYETAGPVLRILALSILLAGLTGPLQGFMLGVGDELAAARISAATAVAAVVSLAVLTPAFGAQGAAWAVVLAHTVTAFLLLNATTRHGLGLFPGPIAVSCGLIVMALGWIAVDLAWIPIMVGIGVAALVPFALSLRQAEQ